jgi:hypothetical protein
MPSSANGIFLAGGQWEDFSTPNRDLRLLIAMDAVLEFPDRVASSPEDYDISSLSSPEKEKKKLQELLDKKVSELSITYTRTDGSEQKLTIKEILERRDAFEMGYNPNDGVSKFAGEPRRQRRAKYLPPTGTCKPAKNHAGSAQMVSQTTASANLMTS